MGTGILLVCMHGTRQSIRFPHKKTTTISNHHGIVHVRNGTETLFIQSGFPARLVEDKSRTFAESRQNTDPLLYESRAARYNSWHFLCFVFLTDSQPPKYYIKLT